LFAIRFQFDGIFAQHLTFQIVQPILNTLSDFSMNRIAAERCKRYAHKEECLNMKKISRRSFLAAAAVSAAALALTACGGSASTASSAAASSVAASSEAASTSAAAGELTTVEAGKLTMATNATFPPYEMTTDSGEFEGIDIDTAKAIADKLGLELQIDDMDFDAALLSVQQGKADIAMAGVTVTDERKAVMDFSDSYATGIQSIIVPNDSDIASPDDLAGKKIGTQRGTTGYIYCSDDFGDDAVVAYDNGLTAVQALNNGQVDAVVIDNAPAKEYVAANPGLKVLDTSYAEEDYAIGMAKGSSLEAAVNAALEELKADGTLQAIVDKYITAE
jgi:ABC-type amino acid transport substrate-binding protein